MSFRMLTFVTLIGEASRQLKEGGNTIPLRNLRKTLTTIYHSIPYGAERMKAYPIHDKIFHEEIQLPVDDVAVYKGCNVEELILPLLQAQHFAHNKDVSKHLVNLTLANFNKVARRVLRNGRRIECSNFTAVNYLYLWFEEHQPEVLKGYPKLTESLSGVVDLYRDKQLLSLHHAQWTFDQLVKRS